MTPLRRQMIEEMQLRGYAQSTIEGYVHAVAQLARHYRRSADSDESDHPFRSKATTRRSEATSSGSC